MPAVIVRYITRAVHRAAVARWHSHHRPTVGETLALGGFVDGELVAAVVMGRPVARRLDDGATWEVTRLVVGPSAPRYTASRLLGAAGRAMDALGITRQISYTRCDERGTCYVAAGWRPVAYVDEDTHARRRAWLPGLHQPSTEAIDRVRWQRHLAVDSPTAVVWTGARWVRSPTPSGDGDEW
jgi:hypothetical protein